MPGSLAPAKKSHSTFCLYTVVLLKCGFVFLWVTWFSWYNMAVQFIPLMSKFQGPKCQEMRFPAFDFQKFSQGSTPPDPQKMVGWNPSYASPRTVYFSGNSGYLKPKENSRCSLFCSPKFPIWALSPQFFHQLYEWCIHSRKFGKTNPSVPQINVKILCISHDMYFL